MIKTIPLYHLELVRDRSIPFTALSTAGQCAEILHELLDRSPVEQMVVIHLDAQFNLVGVEKVGLGSTTAVSVTMADIFRGAIAASVPFIVLGHNHANDDATPSNPDWDLTDNAKAMGMQLGVEVLDHIIVTPTGKHVSMKEEDYKQQGGLASKVLDAIKTLSPEKQAIMKERMRMLGLNPDTLTHGDGKGLPADQLSDVPLNGTSLTDLMQYKLSRMDKAKKN